MRKKELLSLGEFVTVARVCTSLGIEKIRITGGEPTLYRELDDLIAALGTLGPADLAMTTNGSLLPQMPLARWRRLGLRRITLSLDSLRPQRVAAVTRSTATPGTVIEAVRLARDAGFDPIKVNTVVMRGFNDDEIADFADFAREHDVDVRLIEFMPLDSSRAWSRASVVSADEMLRAVGRRHDLVPLDRADPAGTALRFSFADSGPGSIGVIASVTRAFCGACSRLRVTADGKSVTRSGTCGPCCETGGSMAMSPGSSPTPCGPSRPATASAPAVSRPRRGRCRPSAAEAIRATREQTVACPCRPRAPTIEVGTSGCLAGEKETGRYVTAERRPAPVARTRRRVRSLGRLT
jgi:molybdenum cofactor biosynthesis enzyme MoaA